MTVSIMTCSALPAPTNHYQEPHSVIRTLRGQTIVFPDFDDLLKGWPNEVHPQVDRLRQDVNEWLDRTMSHSTRIKGLKAADFGLFGATWWPRASYDRLRIATFLAAWVFVWDDEIDTQDGGLWEDFDLSNAYRDDTLRYVKACLGLTNQPAKSSNPTIKAFGPLGSAIRKAYNHDQCARFVEHFTFYMSSTQQEQTLHLSGRLLSLEEFWSYRLGSSAVHVVLAANEFAWNNRSIPSSIMDGAEMRLLWEYANIIISAVNDLFSLKKELATNSIGNMIPLVYAQLLSSPTATKITPQSAIDHTTTFLRSTIASFDATAQHLLANCDAAHVSYRAEIADAIQGARDFCRGNVAWGLRTPRYGGYVRDGDGGKGGEGSVRVTL